MKKNLLKILDKWPKVYISSGDLRPALNGSSNALHSLLKRAVKEGLLIRLKRDFYLIAGKIREIKPEASEIAPLLYGPSYISLESALSWHHWIPEAVPIINSACSKRTKKIETPIGIFAYYNIPISVFHIGVSSCPRGLPQNKNACFLMADPWKALADLIYLKKKNWPNAIALSNDMRIEIDLMQYSDLNLLEKLAEIYPSKRVKKALNILMKDLSR